MRIQAGIWGGRRIVAGEGDRLRPTADRAREALFNILAHGSAYRTAGGPLPLGISVLDAFAGTGALGLEALSRGAARVSFIDNHPESLRLLRGNLRALGADDDRVSILQRDAGKPGRAPAPHALAFLDPPYWSALAGPALDALATQGWLAPAAIAVVEIAAKETFTPPAGFALLDERRYGAARLVFLRWQPDENPVEP